jgi:hypothetical protein
MPVRPVTVGLIVCALFAAGFGVHGWGLFLLLAFLFEVL